MRCVRVALAAALLLLAGAAPSFGADDGGYGIDVVNADLSLAVELLARSTGRQIVLDGNVPPKTVTLAFRQDRADDAVRFFARTQGLIVDTFKGSYILMRPADAAARSPQALEMKVVRFRYALPSEVQTMVAPAFSVSQSLSIVADDKTRTIVARGTHAQLASIAQVFAALDQPRFGKTLNSQTFKINGGKASEAATALRAGLQAASSAGGENQIVANDAAGTILAIGSPDYLTRVAALVRAYDQYADQVLYDVRIVEITPNDDQEAIGFLTNGFNPVGGSTAGSNANSGTYGTPLNPFTLGYGYLNKTINIATALDLLVSRGQAKVISSPRIMAQNNVQQVLNATEQYPILTSNVSNGVSTQSVNYQPIGLQLKVTPLISADRAVLTTIDASYSAILAFVQTYPVIGQRETTGSFRIANDETLVLSGLIQDQDSETLEKAPFLGDLPLIGTFFRHLSSTHQKTELVFLLTPHVRERVLTSNDAAPPFPLPPQLVPDPVPSPFQMIPAKPVDPKHYNPATQP